MEYTIRCHNEKNGYFTKTVEGTPVILMEGYSFFVHRTLFDNPQDDVDQFMNRWSVTEVSSGYVVATGRDEISAISKAMQNVEGQTEKFIKMVAEAVENNKTLFV